ncbi:MAG: hypothetical protein CMG69_01925 [Candidatus Marinimicrobia bacterium]|nr:hypothetical protein [Candidatus Neomarinimicrobiota bacterium]|tara:strand:- start:150316 stop:150900 length:585 start_codon:yes stop_codon:yes gene_type:complete
MISHFRRIILTGLFTIAPVALTFYFLKVIFVFLDNLSSPIFKRMEIYIPGLGILLTLLLVYFLGLFVTNILGKKILNWLETLFKNIPLVNTIYTTIKQITQAFSGTTGKNFQSVVYIQYPRENLWTLAFVTGDSENENSVEFYHLFVPTTPNPTSGVFIMLPKSDAIETNLNVEEALKSVISGGMLAPKTHKLK